MPEEHAGEKTLPASEQKKRRAREDGNVAKSQDLNSAIGLAAALLALIVFGQYTIGVLIDAGEYYFRNAHRLAASRFPIQGVATQGIYFLAMATLPFMLVMVVTSVLSNVSQVGVLLTGKAIQPKLNRLNPATGLQRFVSLRSLVELLKSIGKLAIATSVAGFYLFRNIEEVVTLIALDPASILPPIAWLAVGVWWRVVVVIAAIGILDYFYQRWQWEQDLRMTQQEAKQETKELEGDPQIKRRVRQLQRQMATQRMIAEVPEADVVITNPVRYAVALRYDMRTMASPTVVAKGERLVAQRIRDLAAEHAVPIIQRPELARNLFRTIDIGQPIPETLFRAVAEVLSYVYQIDQRAGKRRERLEWHKEGAA